MERHHFQEELSALKQRLLAMGGLAEERVRLAMQGLVERDAALIDEVLNGDMPVNELHIYMLSDPSTIEPALDLILISRHLERIGDHATNIAEDVIFMVSGRDVRHHAADAHSTEK